MVFPSLLKWGKHVCKSFLTTTTTATATETADEHQIQPPKSKLTKLMRSCRQHHQLFRTRYWKRQKHSSASIRLNDYRMSMRRRLKQQRKPYSFLQNHPYHHRTTTAVFPLLPNREGKKVDIISKFECDVSSHQFFKTSVVYKQYENLYFPMFVHRSIPNVHTRGQISKYYPYMKNVFRRQISDLIYNAIVDIRHARYIFDRHHQDWLFEQVIRSFAHTWTLKWDCEII